MPSGPDASCRFLTAAVALPCPEPGLLPRAQGCPRDASSSGLRPLSGNIWKIRVGAPWDFTEVLILEMATDARLLFRCWGAWVLLTSVIPVSTDASARMHARS